MLLIDTNSLVVLILGLMDPKLIDKHKRTSIYEKTDFDELVNFIGDTNRLIIVPNVWTEVDNLLNDFSGNYKYPYLLNIKKLIHETTEKYITSRQTTTLNEFDLIGLTDTLLLGLAKTCECLITSDTKLSDYAIAQGIVVYDMVKKRNERFK